MWEDLSCNDRYSLREYYAAVVVGIDRGHRSSVVGVDDANELVGNHGVSARRRVYAIKAEQVARGKRSRVVHRVGYHALLGNGVEERTHVGQGHLVLASRFGDDAIQQISTGHDGGGFRRIEHELAGQGVRLGGRVAYAHREGVAGGGAGRTDDPTRH